MFDRIACGRLPREYRLPIICDVTLSAREKPDSSPNPLGAGDEWEMFRKCCPMDSDNNVGMKNRYYTEYNCVSKYCATTNQRLAEDWDDCVKGAVKSASKESDSITVNSRCEWVDYDLVEKGRAKENAAASPKLSKVGALVYISMVMTMYLM